MFKLHTRLKADTFEIARLGLSRMLLMNDKSLPWLILVPERKGVRELDQLAEADRARLMEEIVIASRAIQHLYAIDKMNIGALGNLVPQLHLHVIGRYRTDRAWPGPIWGTGPGVPYTKEEAKEVCKRLKEAIKKAS